MTVDKDLVRQRFARSINTYDSEAYMQAQISKELALHISDFCRDRKSRILEIGAGTGLLTREVLRVVSPQSYFINDLVPELCAKTETYFNDYPHINHEVLAGDMEELPVPRELDLIISGSALQWFRNLDRFFQRAAEALKPGGHFIFNTFGPSNFQEIQKLTGTGLSYSSMEEVEKVAQRYFQVEKTYEEIHSLTQDSPLHVLKHMKATGVNGSANQKWTRGQMTNFTLNYIDQFKVDGGVSLTYHPIYFVLRKKH